MNELVSISTNLHVFFVFLMLIFAFVNLFVIKSCSDYIDMTKKYEFFSPLYYLSLSIVIFTGSVVLAVFKFAISYTVYLMIFTSIIVIAGAFKTHRLFKLTRVRDVNSQEVFRKFAVKKYILDIVLIIISIVLGFMFA